jgi:uncharacterized protein
METQIVKIENPAGLNFIFGQSHFIKTVEDLHETLVSAVPEIKFGLAFAEASGQMIMRSSGTDDKLAKLAVKNLMAIGAGHTFLIFLGNAYPINVLNSIKMIPEVVHLFCATANPVEVVVVESEQGRGIMGIIDGGKPTRVEKPADVDARKKFLRTLGYKL